MALLRIRLAEAMPLPVGLVVVSLRLGAGRIARCGSRRGVLLCAVGRRRRRIAVLLLWRVALALIGLRRILRSILRTVLLLLLRRRSVLILLLRRRSAVVRILAVRVGIGVVGVRIVAAIIWISVGVRVAVIAAVVGITESESESPAAAPAITASITVATIAAAISTDSAAAVSSASNSVPTVTTASHSSATEAATTAYSVAASTTAMSATAPLGETSPDGENQRYECDLQRAHRKLPKRPSNRLDATRRHSDTEFYLGIISFSTYLPTRSTSTLIAVPGP